MIVYKMHALGQDFCLVEAEPYMEYSKLAIKLCNRTLGVGALGLIVVKYDPLEMLYYTNEGERMPMNANAIRCFSKFVFEKGMGIKNSIDITTGNGKILVEKVSDRPFMCSVALGKPIINNSMIRVSDELNCFGRTILVGNKYFTLYSLYLGDIETVIFVDDFDNCLEYAKDIAKYSIFSRGTNVNFVKVLAKDTIRVKSYDRLNGFVESSGSGCAASVYVAQKLGYTKTNVKAEVEMGVLRVEITKKGIINLTGMASSVFTCDFKEEE